MKIDHRVRSKVPGMGAALLVAIVGYVAGLYLPGFGAVLLSLFFGILAGNTIFHQSFWEPGLRFTEKYVLETAIVLIGFGFNLKLLLGLGWELFAWLVISVIAVALFSAFVGRRFGTSSRFNYLLGAGSAICGSAAIAAVSPLIKADEEETGLALALINLLGLLGILFLPVLSLILGYSHLQAGMLTGGVLQSMGHVVAASFTLGETTGGVATVVKMIRISLLVPFLLFLAFINQTGPKSRSSSGKFPVFVMLFIISVAIGQLKFFPQEWSSSLAGGGDMLLVVAMAGIGMKIRIKPLLKISFKGSMVGLMVFLFQILLFVFLISFHLL